VRLKQDKPSWGAPKIRERLARLYPDVHTPAISMVRAVLDRHVATIFRAGHGSQRPDWLAGVVGLELRNPSVTKSI
jgi:hypothetical protein